MRKLFKSLLACFLLASSLTFGQTTDVTGTVTGEDGQPVVGASVREKGTNRGVATNASGAFTLKVNSNAVLEISAIGYETREVSSGNASSIVLKTSANNLNEVVVTGLGVATSRKKVAIDVASLSTKNVAKSAASLNNLEQALQGQIAGASVQFTSGLPGTSAQIVLRGLNDLSGSGPMILIDGIEVKGGLTGLDLSAVERIEVVKGAAAGTLYGAQGANGVIQVFTKKGTRRKNTIDVRSTVSFDEILRGNDLIAKKHHFQTDAQGFITRGGTRLQPDANGAWPDPVFGDAGLSIVDAGKIVNDKPYRETTYDQIGQAYRRAITSNTNLNIGGGGENTDYAFNLGYLNQQNVLFNGFKRINLGANVGFNLAKGLTLRNNLQAIYVDEDLLAGGSRFNLTNSWPFIDFNSRDSKGFTTVKPKINENQLNPLSEREWRERGAQTLRLINNINLNYKFPRFVELDYKYGVELSHQDLNDYYKNQRIAPQSANGFWGTTVDGSITSRLNKFTFQNSLATAIAKFDFEKDFKSNLPLISTTQVSYDWRKSENRQFFAQGLVLPTYPPYNIDVAQNKNSGDYRDQFITFGYLVNQTFDWGNLFGISGGFRSDFSSEFGEAKDPQTFLRGTAYFRPSELLDVNWLSDWKVRTAYGEAGIQPYPAFPFARQVVLDVTTTGVGGVGLGLPTLARNAALLVQRSKELEIGTDFTIRTGSKEWLSRFTVNATYWNRTTEDIIQPADLAPSTGFAQVLDNLTVLKSKGFDLSIDADVAQKKDFSWNFGFRFGTFDVVADKIANNADVVAGIFALKEGESLGTFFSQTPLTRVDQLRPDKTPYIPEANRGNYEIVNGMVVDKVTKRVSLTDPNDQTVVGSAFADFNASFINSFTIKQNFIVSFQLDWRQGNEIYNLTRQWLYRDRLSTDFDQPITVGGSTGAFPAYYNSLYNNVSPLSWFVENGSFLRMRDASITYMLKDAFRPKWLRTAGITLSGRNLFTITKFSGLDPESTNTNDSQGNAANNIGVINGVDAFGVPNLRSYQISLNLGF